MMTGAFTFALMMTGAFTFALMMTRAFSQNVGKLFSELNLVTVNLLFIYAETS